MFLFDTRPTPLRLWPGLADYVRQAEYLVNERWHSVCEHLGVARDTVYRWIDRRGLPAHRVARLWKFKLPEVDEGGASGASTMRRTAMHLVRRHARFGSKGQRIADARGSGDAHGPCHQGREPGCEGSPGDAQRRLQYNPLTRPPLGLELRDVTSEHRSAVKHQPKSRVRETRASGFERNASCSPRLAFN